MNLPSSTQREKIVPCPSCGALIDESVPKCPKCGARGPKLRDQGLDAPNMGAGHIVILCPKCPQKLRVPVREKAILITCKCGHQFVHPGTNSDGDAGSTGAFMHLGTSKPFVEAVQSGFKNYFNFKGRASRSEWWYWALFVNAVIFALVFAQLLSNDPYGVGVFAHLVEGFILITMIPGLSMHVRRLHDINRSGWWLLIIPTILGIGQIVMWMFVATEPASNKYGPPPLTKSKPAAPPVKYPWLKYAVAVASALAGLGVGNQTVCYNLSEARWRNFESMVRGMHHCQDSAGLYFIGSLLTSFFVCRYVNERLGKPVLGSFVGLAVGAGTGAATAYIYFNNLYG